MLFIAMVASCVSVWREDGKQKAKGLIAVASLQAPISVFTGFSRWGLSEYINRHIYIHTYIYIYCIVLSINASCGARATYMHRQSDMIGFKFQATHETSQHVR